MVFPPWLAYLLLCPAVEGGCWYMGGSDDYTNQLGRDSQTEAAPLMDALFSE